MKTQVMIAVAIIILTAGAVAQVVPSYTLRAQIPFAFVVGGDVLPAGDYRLQIPNASPGPIMVRQSGGNKDEIVLQVPVQEQWQGHSQLTFHKLAGVYYLVEVADPRGGVQRVQQGKRYKDAQKLAVAQTVMVAAK